MSVLLDDKMEQGAVGPVLRAGGRMIFISQGPNLQIDNTSAKQQIFTFLQTALGHSNQTEVL